MSKVTLQFPVTLADGRTVDSITLRRAKVRDLKTAQRHGSDQVEQEIMLLFSTRAGETIPRHELIGNDTEVGERTIDVQIGRLRRHVDVAHRGFEAAPRGRGGAEGIRHQFQE